MQIILRGKKVRTMVITKSLSKTEVDHYKLTTLRENNTASTPGTVSFPGLFRITLFYLSNSTLITAVVIN